ncbi:MAG TPA: FixH family protein [Bacteroidia bacterium]|nr:FixH family protein [Bacteroidota bacterium]HRC32297.1 FixH family protein [Bacteroidia bacterium]
MKLNWGFGIAMVYIIFAGSMIAFVVVASRQNYDLVSENYYDDAVKYQQTIDAENNGTRKESQLDIVYVQDKNAIQLSGGAQMKNVKGKLSFYKPDKATNDFQIPFSTDDSSMQTIPLPTVAHGYWSVNANWNVEGKNYSVAKRIFIQ